MFSRRPGFLPKRAASWAMSSAEETARRVHHRSRGRRAGQHARSNDNRKNPGRKLPIEVTGFEAGPNFPHPETFEGLCDEQSFWRTTAPQSNAWSHRLFADGDFEIVSVSNGDAAIRKFEEFGPQLFWPTSTCRARTAMKSAPTSKSTRIEDTPVILLVELSTRLMNDATKSARLHTSRNPSSRRLW